MDKEQETFPGPSGKEHELSRQIMFNLLSWDLFNFSHSICITVHFLLLTSINFNKEAFFSVILPLSPVLCCYKQ